MISAVIANPGRPARLLVSRSDLVWHPLQQDTPVELLFASQTPKMCLCVCVCVSVCLSFSLAKPVNITLRVWGLEVK
jgi:hypothetical protein